MNEFILTGDAFKSKECQDNSVSLKIVELQSKARLDLKLRNRTHLSLIVPEAEFKYETRFEYGWLHLTL